MLCSGAQSVHIAFENPLILPTVQGSRAIDRMAGVWKNVGLMLKKR